MASQERDAGASGTTARAMTLAKVFPGYAGVGAEGVVDGWLGVWQLEMPHDWLYHFRISRTLLFP